jgi:hypothetical protein
MGRVTYSQELGKRIKVVAQRRILARNANIVNVDRAASRSFSTKQSTLEIIG